LREQFDAVYEYSYTDRVSQAIKSLVLYKRHLQNCAVHKTRLPRAKRRFWMNCECPIWIYGRTPAGDIVPRQSTQFSDLKCAEALRASLMAQIQTGSVTGPPLSECIENISRRASWTSIHGPCISIGSRLRGSTGFSQHRMLYISAR